MTDIAPRPPALVLLDADTARHALEDAIALRFPGPPCPACNQDPSGRCEDCDATEQLAQDYRDALGALAVVRPRVLTLVNGLCGHAGTISRTTATDQALCKRAVWLGSVGLRHWRVESLSPGVAAARQDRDGTCALCYVPAPDFDPASDPPQVAPCQPESGFQPRAVIVPGGSNSWPENPPERPGAIIAGRADSSRAIVVDLTLIRDALDDAAGYRQQHCVHAALGAVTGCRTCDADAATAARYRAQAAALDKLLDGAGL